MPAVNWIRTNLGYVLERAGPTLRFDRVDFVAYDIFVLEHPDAKQSYSETLIVQACAHFNTMNDAQINLLEQNIIAGPPSGEK